MPKVFGIKIAGPAGAGIMSAGEILFRALVKSGYFAIGYPEYPSLIKGGHNTFLITVSDEENPNNSNHIDVLVALTQNALNEEHSSIDSNTTVICDQTIKPDHKIEKLNQVPLLETAKLVGNPLYLNTVAIGIICHQLKIKPEVVWPQIEEELKGKSQELIDQNKKTFEEAQKLSEKYHLNLNLPETKNTDHLLCLNGNTCLGLGAIAAGVNFYAGYPMTPSSPLLHFMAAHQEEFGYIVRQAEDEIGAINMIIGASFAGAKSMTATSGGGFALMNEGLSLSAMVETPVVISLGMRPAPATGLPTWTSQSDLLYAINAGHGEFPKVILAPSDPTECYLLTWQAFDLSQRFHIPVIILSDKYLVENLYSIKNLPELDPVPLSVKMPSPGPKMYQRYQFNLSGTNPRTLPGMPGGEYIANSDEHNAEGLVDETAANRNGVNQRRFAKLSEIKKEIPLPEIKGEAKKALISWGSHKYIAAAAAKELNYSHIHFSHLWPLPLNLEKTLSSFESLISTENNTTGQLARLLTMETRLKIDNIGEDSGRPLSVESIINMIKK